MAQGDTQELESLRETLASLKDGVDESSKETADMEHRLAELRARLRDQRSSVEPVVLQPRDA